MKRPVGTRIALTLVGVIAAVVAVAAGAGPLLEASDPPTVPVIELDPQAGEPKPGERSRARKGRSRPGPERDGGSPARREPDDSGAPDEVADGTGRSREAAARDGGFRLAPAPPPKVVAPPPPPATREPPPAAPPPAVVPPPPSGGVDDDDDDGSGAGEDEGEAD